MESNEICTIKFNDEQEQSKVFNYLAHNHKSFVGVDLTTINISKDDCNELENKGFQFQKIISA